MDVVLEHSHIQTIAHHFGLGDVAVLERVERVYGLHAQNGKFALRFYNASVTLAHVQATQALRLALVEAGLPVGAPIRNAAGETVLEFDGRFVELQPWIAHDGYGNNWPGVLAAATALGRMHDVMATCRVALDQRDDPWRGPAELADQLEADAAHLRHLARQSGMDIDHDLRLAEHVLEALREGGMLDACLRQLTHGDFQGRNLLFQGSSLVGIIDFERLETRPRLYDLAWPFVFWRFFGTGMGDYDASDWRFARICCAAYAAASQTALGDREWSTLPLLMAYIPARGVAQAAGEAAPVGEVVAFAKALGFAAWLVQHPDEAIFRLKG
jgi:Ser/Thr protein kinase RdoA (MazF antagonist)